VIHAESIPCMSPAWPAPEISCKSKRSEVHPSKLPLTRSATTSAMRWPPWSSDASKDDDKKRPVAWANILNATNWSHYTGPETVVPTVLLTTTILLSIRVYRLYLRRIPEATHVQPGFFRKRSLFGTVTRVGDGDNFHLYHTPGGRLAGWGWLRKVPQRPIDLKKRTVRISYPIIMVVTRLTPS